MTTSLPVKARRAPLDLDGPCRMADIIATLLPIPAFATVENSCLQSHMFAHEALGHLKTAFKFQAVGDAVGNLTLGRGESHGNAVHLALVENRMASGALGAKECDQLASLFKIIATTKSPLVMYLDSAGAKVSEGLPALGAFRHMFRAGLAMADSGAPIAAVCGANCFGGASMLACLAGTRYFSANTRLAMSGPAILAQSAGVSVLDEMFQAMSMAAIGMEGRTHLSTDNLPVSADTFKGEIPVSVSNAARHLELGRRLAKSAMPGGSCVSEKIERRDLARLYPDGYAVVERDGVLAGDARRDGAPIVLLGFIGGKALGAARAWAFAEAVWKMCAAPPKTLQLLVDCDSHSTALDDERIMLSAYLVNMSAALFALGLKGTRIETTVLGKLGGGGYVALCAPAAQVNLLFGAEIQLLPGKAIASILGEQGAQQHGFEEYAAARVADQEIKLGIV